jgi:NAD(P)-dependent dehydrogenase (short-subunit alcohol dehydrogenase family)
MKDFGNGTTAQPEQHSLRANGSHAHSMAHSMAHGRFAGKVVLLTGKQPVENASLALRFAQLGTDVAIVYRADLGDKTAVAQQTADIKAAIKATGRRCLFLPVSVPADQSPAQLVQQIIATFGRLDFFISRPTFAQTESGRLLPQIQLAKAAMQAILNY